MNHPVLLVPHQEIYLQSWKNFPEIRWHMLVTGFGGGKTRANVILTLMLVRELQGLKDRAGDGARIIVAGYTLLHLERTFLLYFKSYLDSSKTEYRYDSKTHIFYIGTVTILLIPMETPENIFGEDCCIEGSQRIITLRGLIPMKDVQVGDYVLTRKGFKQVLTKWLKGDKITYNYGGLICTPDHKIITEKGAEEICKAKNLYSLKEQNISGSEKLGEAQAVLSRLRKLFGLMSCGDGTKEVHTSYATEMEETTHYIMRSMQNLSETSQPDGMSITPMDTMTTGRKVSSASAHHSMQESITSKGTRLPFSSINTNSTCQKATTTTLSHAQNVEKSTHLTDATAETNDALSAGSCSTEEMRWSILKESVLSFLQEFAKFVEKNFREESDRTAALSADIDRIRCLTGTTSARTAEKLSSQKASLKESNDALSARKSSRKNLTTNTDIELLTELVQSAEQLSEELLTRIVANSTAEEKVPEGSPAGIRTVYDIEVEDAHEFFAEGVLVHNCACIQEESDELPEATLIEACKALSERTRQQIIGFRSPFICLGTTSQGESGLYRLYCQFKKKGTGFVLIRGRTQDNFYLPKEQIIDLYKMYDDTERRVFLEGEFLAVSRNRVFPGFDWARNYSDDDFDKYLKPGERVFIGADFNIGMNRASAWVAREGVMHCVKSYDFPDASDSPDVFRYDFPDQDIYWIPDVTTKDSYPQYARALRKNNIHIIHRSKNPLVEDTAFLVSVLCKNSRIVFHKMAREAADSIARAVRDKDGKIGKGKAPSDWQHYADGVRYACSYMALVLPDFRDIRQSLITHIASLRREVEKDEPSPVRKLAAGYTQIDPAAFFKK